MLGKSVAIVDDHPAIRWALRNALQDGGYCVSGEASSLEWARELLRDVPSDYLILDLALDGGEAFDLLGEVVRTYPEMKTLVFSMHGLPRVIRSVLQAGAHGFFSKMDDLSALGEALSAVSNGSTFLSRTAKKALEDETAPTRQVSPQQGARISKGEREVLELLGKGFGRAAIAQKRQVTAGTIETQLRQLTRKLGLKNRQALKQYAVSLWQTWQFSDGNPHRAEQGTGSQGTSGSEFVDILSKLMGW